MPTILYNKKENGPVEINLPGSKSMGARALILDFIYGREGRQDVPDCDDNRELTLALCCLRNLMDKGEIAEESLIEFNLGRGATSVRFFIALVASLPGCNIKVDCDEQMRVRPIAPLVDSLRAFGADIKYVGEEGKLPMVVRGRRLSGGGVYNPYGGSSQFASAIAMTSLLWESPVEIICDGMVSSPYFKMTTEMIARKGEGSVEPDWSAATFIYVSALLCPKLKIMLPGLLSPDLSLQGDAAGVVDIFSQLGIVSKFSSEGVKIYYESVNGLPKTVSYNMENYPDMVPALVVGLLMKGVKFTLTGVKNLRIKECNRLGALCSEMLKLGYVVQEGDDSLCWDGEMCEPDENPLLSCYSDHRMAMAFALIAFVNNQVRIDNVECVAKSFPNYFAEVDKLGLKVKT